MSSRAFIVFMAATVLSTGLFFYWALTSTNEYKKARAEMFQHCIEDGHKDYECYGMLRPMGYRR